MLAHMTPAQFHERMAADLLDPINDTWDQAGVIAATVHNEIQRIISGFSKSDMAESDIHTERQYQPPIRLAEKTKPASTDDDLKAFVESAKAIVEK
jgi:hypothetical protein